MAPRWPLVLACGKFQPFHNDHLRYVAAAFDVGEQVVIGITNPDPGYVRFEEADPQRSEPTSNPASYYERLLMVTGAMSDLGIERERYEVVPFPLNVPQSWASYVPLDAVVLLTLYDDDPWLDRRRQLLQQHGLRTHVLWRKAAKGVVGADVRRRIGVEQAWEPLVPAATVRVLRERGITDRIRRASG